MEDQKPAETSQKAEAPKTDTPKQEAVKPEPPKEETPKADGPKAEAPKTDAPKQEGVKAEAPKEAPKKEKPANCAVCNKSIKKKRYYYRNGKYYCTKRCWKTTIKKDNKEAGEKPEAKA